MRVRGFLLFFLFLLLAAPIEFDLAVFFGGAEDALVRGVLYFFAVTVAIEAMVRLATFPYLARRHSIFALKALLFVPIILFGVDFMPRKFGGNPNAIGQWRYQTQAAFVAAALSLITHVVLDAAHHASKRARGA